MEPFEGIMCVSIAVPKIEAVLPAYVEGLGLEITHPIQESQRGFGMNWIELGREGVTFLELIEPTGDSGPIASFLRKEGPSRVYQVRFGVQDLEITLSTLETRGLRILRGQVVESQPNIGWVHPASTGGAMFELMELIPSS